MISPCVDALYRTFVSLLSTQEKVIPNQNLSLNDLDAFIIKGHIFSTLGKKDLDAISLVNRRFCQLSREIQSERVRAIAFVFPGERRLPATRIRCPRLDAPFQECSSFLNKLEQRIIVMNSVLPEELRSPYSPEDMALRVDAHILVTFFQNGYLHSLKQSIGQLAGVPETDSLEDSATKIRTWLAHTNVSFYSWINIQSRHMVCLPKELCLFTGAQTIYAENNGIDFIPEEIKLLPQLKKIYLHNNPISAHPSEFSKMDGLPVRKFKLFIKGVECDSIAIRISKIAIPTIVLGIATTLTVSETINHLAGFSLSGVAMFFAYIVFKESDTQ